MHGECTYDSVFNQNLTFLEKLDVEWPAVVGVLELEGELRFNLFASMAAPVCSISGLLSVTFMTIHLLKTVTCFWCDQRVIDVSRDDTGS